MCPFLKGLHFFCFFVCLLFGCVLVFFPFFLRFRKSSRFFFHFPSFVPTFHWYPFLFPGFCRALLGCIDLWLAVFDLSPAVHRCQQEFHCKFPGCCYLLLSSMVCGHWSYSCVICLHSLGPFFLCFFGHQNGFRSTKMQGDSFTEVMLPNKVHGYRL